MQRLWRIYHDSVPELLLQLSQTPPMQRLRNVGMNCGCEYTAFRRFEQLRPYSRFDHSVGTALIVWHFTHEPAQAAAGLLHDVATPTFAHVVDFLHGDYLTQESTENGTKCRIAQSPELQAVLQHAGLTTQDVCDYHRYPIADNDAPRLSADRLEYTLGNLLNYRLAEIAQIRSFYDGLCVADNEDGVPELAFREKDTALSFAECALACSQIYVSDEDRYSMQILAELLRGAIEASVLSEKDLDTDEPSLLRKLCADPAWAERWAAYRAMRRMERTSAPSGEGWRRIDAKRRRIDPFIVDHGRVSEVFPSFGERLKRFAAQPFDEWIRATAEKERK